MIKSKKEKLLIIYLIGLIVFGIIAFPMALNQKISNPFVYYKDFLMNTISPKLSGTVYLKNVPVYLEGETGFSQYELNKLNKEISDVLLQNCSEIYVCDASLENSTCKNNYDGISINYTGNALPQGFVQQNDNTVYIFSVSNNYQETILHELGHLYDYKYNLHNQQELITLYNQYQKDFQNGSTNFVSDEFFAEITTTYFLTPNKLIRKYSSIYNYCQSIYNYYN